MRIYFFLIAILVSLNASAQTADSIPQKDVMDIVKSFHKKGNNLRKDTIPPKNHKIELSVAPAVGYSLSTGIAAIVATNAAFYLGDHAKTNLSAIAFYPIYTQLNQVNMPIEANIWTKNNGFNITSDWRFMVYPSNTYGLGTKTIDSDAALLNFNYIRLYQSILKNLGRNWYAGIGYNLDYYWKTTLAPLPNNRVSDAENENLTPKSLSQKAASNT
jgi:hypothetical protein